MRCCNSSSNGQPETFLPKKFPYSTGRFHRAYHSGKPLFSFEYLNFFQSENLSLIRIMP